MSCETHGCKLILAVRAAFHSQTLTDAIESKHEVMKLGEDCIDVDWPDDRFGTVKISRQVKLKETLFARYVCIGC